VAAAGRQACGEAGRRREVGKCRQAGSRQAGSAGACMRAGRCQQARRYEVRGRQAGWGWQEAVVQGVRRQRVRGVVV